MRDDAHVTAGCGLEVRFVEGEIRLRPLLERPLSSLAQVAACLCRPDRKLLSEADTKAAIRAKLKAVIHSVSSALGQKPTAENDRYGARNLVALRVSR